MFRLMHQLIFTLATQWCEHTMQKKDNSGTASNNRDNSSYI